MTLEFYNVSDDPRVVSKTLGTKLQNITNAYLKDNTDLIKPTFILSGRIDATNFGNYVYAKEFGRYYFVTNRTAFLGDKTAISCEVDVLMSWKSAIFGTDVIVFNQTKHELADGLISDPRLPMQVNTESRTFAFKRGELSSAMNTNNETIVFSCFAGGASG